MNNAVRNAVRARAARRCEYCRLPDSADEWPFHVDHLVARVHGGDDDLTNLCWSCTQCNLFNPRLMNWEENFELRPNGQISGRTPAARATVRLLDMNGSPQLDLRRDLLTQNEFSQ